ncbi:cytochrome P450 [Gemmatirosa kalamazoonensis]|uniref:Cytochrome P450 n=1 Tax=Gemmatirosa kalamazoonensis TaxID=861299 RepID=W0RHM0_9BACT|nr:cytochrome P450 [Gemmatirosa kalamazoonensis]AHG90261.1 cytochrome P450 [Gemmatirosa kalamazoonensis]
MRFLFSDDVRRDPYPWYAELRRASPVLRDPRTGTWMVFDYHGVRRALDDHDAFGSDVSAAGYGNLGWFIFFDPPRHTKMRALISRAFTPRTVAGLEPRVREIARGLLDTTAGRDAFDVVGDFAVPLPLMVIAELLGAPADDWSRFRRWSDVILELALTLQGGAEAQHAVAAFTAVRAEMARYLAELLDVRRDAPRDDLLSRLLAAEVDGSRLSDGEILAFFQLLLLAGHETTTNLIGNAVISFAEHPEQLARLRADPTLLPSAVEEVLRYRSPVQAVFRVTRRDVTLGGHAIPARSLVLAMIGSANRDPSRFPAPDAFDVARAPNAHVAFGHGIHFCLGAPLSRLEARVALGELLARTETIALADDQPWEPRAAFHVHGATRLPIHVTPRSASATTQGSANTNTVGDPTCSLTNRPDGRPEATATYCLPSTA